MTSAAEEEKLTVYRKELVACKARDVLVAYFDKYITWDKALRHILNLKEAYKFPLLKWSKYEKVEV